MSALIYSQPYNLGCLYLAVWRFFGPKRSQERGRGESASGHLSLDRIRNTRNTFCGVTWVAFGRDRRIAWGKLSLLPRWKMWGEMP